MAILFYELSNPILEYFGKKKAPSHECEEASIE